MTNPVQIIRLGTRGSALALRQTEIVAQALRDCDPHLEIAIHTVQTEGDRVQDRPISQLGDKGVFVRAIEAAVLDGRIDLAIHSLKDVPSDVEVAGLTLAAFSPRADPRDCMVVRDTFTLESLPRGATIGTSSLRRRAQLLQMRPDLVVAPTRGNVDTRLRKLRAGEYDAILLAAAGLYRLGLHDVITEYLPVERFIPDAGQGIIAIQARVGDRAASLAARIDDPTSRAAATAERATVRALGASCHSPVGAYATVDGNMLHIRGVAATEDGSVVCRAEVTGGRDDAEALGTQLGIRLLGMLPERQAP